MQTRTYSRMDWTDTGRTNAPANSKNPTLQADQKRGSQLGPFSVPRSGLTSLHSAAEVGERGNFIWLN